QVKEFVNKIAALAGDGGLSEAIAAAEEMLAAGEIDDAAQTFAAILEEDPNSAAAFAGLARTKLAKGEIDDAEAVLNGAPAGISHAAEIDAVHAQIALARQAAEAGPVADL